MHKHITMVLLAAFFLLACSCGPGALRIDNRYPARGEYGFSDIKADSVVFYFMAGKLKKANLSVSTGLHLYKSWPDEGVNITANDLVAGLSDYVDQGYLVGPVTDIPGGMEIMAGHVSDAFEIRKIEDLSVTGQVVRVPIDNLEPDTYYYLEMYSTIEEPLVLGRPLSLLFKTAP